MILSAHELQHEIQQELNTCALNTTNTHNTQNPKNKLQLLREYFTLCGRIMRMRHDIKLAKNNTERVKKNISKTRILPGYFVKPYWYEWGDKYPCVLVHLRRGMRDMYTGAVFNFGDPEDVKTFCCPYFSWNQKCTRTAKCDYTIANTEYFDAKHALADALNTYKATNARRKKLRKQIFSRNK